MHHSSRGKSPTEKEEAFQIKTPKAPHVIARVGTGEGKPGEEVAPCVFGPAQGAGSAKSDQEGNVDGVEGGGVFYLNVAAGSEAHSGR